MYLFDPGSLRPVLAFVLAVIGVIFRFVLPTSIGGFGLRRFRTHPDEDISLRVRTRIGDMLLAWSLWTFLQMVVGVRESYFAILWAPLSLLVILTASYAARLYTRRYPAGRETRKREIPSSTSGWRGWFWVAIREGIPLGTILMTILTVKSAYPEIPDEIPVGWSLRDGAPTLMDAESGLRTLRHRTAFVYLLLFSLEGVYLIFRWARGNREDIARTMLTRAHWMYFLFKVTWVFFLAGINLGVVMSSIDGRPILPYLFPGVMTLAALIFLAFRPGIRKPSS